MYSAYQNKVLFTSDNYYLHTKVWFILCHLIPYLHHLGHTWQSTWWFKRPCLIPFFPSYWARPPITSNVTWQVCGIPKTMGWGGVGGENVCKGGHWYWKRSIVLPVHLHVFLVWGFLKGKQKNTSDQSYWFCTSL